MGYFYCRCMTASTKITLVAPATISITWYPRSGDCARKQDDTIQLRTVFYTTVGSQSLGY